MGNERQDGLCIDVTRTPSFKRGEFCNFRLPQRGRRLRIGLLDCSANPLFKRLESSSPNTLDGENAFCSSFLAPSKLQRRRSDVDQKTSAVINQDLKVPHRKSKKKFRVWIIISNANDLLHPF